MPETPNHGYNVPEEGTDDWHEPLNENFEQYDTDIEIRDEGSNLDDYEPKSGAKFLATDTGTVYLGAGSAWQEAFELGGVASLAGVEPDADGDVAVASPDGSIQVTADAATSTLEFGLADGVAGGGGVQSIDTVDPDADGDVSISSPDGSIEVTGDAAASELEFTVADDLAGGVQSIAGVEPDSTGNVGLSSPGGRIQVTGDAAANELELALPETVGFRALNTGNTFLGVGRESAITGAEYFGVGTPAGNGEFGGSYVDTDGSGGKPFYGYATAGNGKAWHYYDGSSSEWRLSVGGSDVLAVDTSGNLDVSGNKNFAQTVDTDDGEREVVYTATEAGTPYTEASGVAELADGRAEVDLPEHFGWVTSDEEPLHVQTTPHSAASGGLAVVERSTERVVVEDLDGEGGYEFSYTVKGTRDGHADKEVVREPSAESSAGSAPAPADD